MTYQDTDLPRWIWKSGIKNLFSSFGPIFPPFPWYLICPCFCVKKSGAQINPISCLSMPYGPAHLYPGVSLGRMVWSSVVPSKEHVWCLSTPAASLSAMVCHWLTSQLTICLNLLFCTHSETSSRSCHVNTLHLLWCTSDLCTALLCTSLRLCRHPYPRLHTATMTMRWRLKTLIAHKQVIMGTIAKHTPPHTNSSFPAWSNALLFPWISS